jgi:hypothetical protein
MTGLLKKLDEGKQSSMAAMLANTNSPTEAAWAKKIFTPKLS